MRRGFACVLLLAVLLSGCKQAQEESSIILASDPVESYDNESVYLPEGTDTSEEQDTSGFVVKDKIYTYGKNNVALVSIKNETDKDYTLTVNGTYLDKDGKVLKTETQTFCDFVSGYQRYFLFCPETAFASFSYTLSYEEFAGEPRLSTIKQVEWDFDHADYQVWPEPNLEKPDVIENVLYTKWGLFNESGTTFHVKSTVVAIDGNGNVLCIQPLGYQEIPADTATGMGVEIYRTTGELKTDRSTWPEHIQKGLTLIVIPMDAMTVEEFREWMSSVRN